MENPPGNNSSTFEQEYSKYLKKLYPKAIENSANSSSACSMGNKMIKCLHNSGKTDIQIIKILYHTVSR